MNVRPDKGGRADPSPAVAATIVPRALADVVRELASEFDPPLGRGAHRYVLREGCWFCAAVPAGEEGYWLPARDRWLQQGDLYLPTIAEVMAGEAPMRVTETSDVPNHVVRFIPPREVPGTLTFIAVAEGTQITCDGCDLADAEDYLREAFPELFERRKGRGMRLEAEAFLCELLADGEMWADEVKQAARENGIKAKTLRNASEYVTDWRRGEGNRTIWRLRGQQPVEHSPSPGPYARTRARCTGENEGHEGPEGHEPGAEPKVGCPSDDEGHAKGHATPESACPIDAKGTPKGTPFLALQAVHALDAVHAPQSDRDIARVCAREGTTAEARRASR